jgi:hypothetical protein
MGSMASRAPLLVAAALFFVGVAGLLATIPGREAGGAFVPLVRGGSAATVQSVPAIDPTVPSLSLFVPITAVQSAGVFEETTTPVATAAPPTPTPTPVLHSAVVAAVANDVSPTPGVPHSVMVSSDGDGETPTASTTPDPTKAAEAGETPEASATPAS